MSLCRVLIGLFFLFSSVISFGQHVPPDSGIHVPIAYYKAINAKADKFNHRVSKYSEKTLSKLIRQVHRIKRKLQRIDSTAASRLFNNSIDSLKKLAEGIQKISMKARLSSVNYMPYMDSLNTSLAFLKQFGQVSENINGFERINESLEKVGQINARLEMAEDIQKYIRERRKLLFQELSRYKVFEKELHHINKEVHYYAQAISGYKQILKDPVRLESIAMRLLQKLPAFRDFFESNSQLSGLFVSSNANSASTTAIGGLQPRFAVQQSIAARGYGPAVNINSMMQEQARFAQGQLDKLKDKINRLGGLEEDEIPSFKGNSQKTKVFWQRLEYGGNIQFGKSNNLLPATTDLAIQLGYKINDKSSIGTGLSYKAGFSVRALNDMKFTHEGFGLRSFIDYRLVGKFYVQGGFECNYFSQFSNLAQLHYPNSWQQSVLIGLSRKYSISKKMNGSVQFLYDFLYRKHIPNAQPLLFRIGYSFK